MMVIEPIMKFIGWCLLVLLLVVDLTYRFDFPEKTTTQIAIDYMTGRPFAWFFDIIEDEE